MRATRKLSGMSRTGMKRTVETALVNASQMSHMDCQLPSSCMKRCSSTASCTVKTAYVTATKLMAANWTLPEGTSIAPSKPRVRNVCISSSTHGSNSHSIDGVKPTEMNCDQPHVHTPRVRSAAQTVYHKELARREMRRIPGPWSCTTKGLPG